MTEIIEENIEEIKIRLRGYNQSDVDYNEPHFTHQLILREGTREEVIKNLLNPDELFYSYAEKGKYGDIVHCLHFKISSSRTLRLPVIFDKDGKKGLYILTYIMRHRKWQNMVRVKRR